MLIPNLFRKSAIPDRIPGDMEKKIKQFSKTKDKKRFVRLCFNHLVSMHRGARINLLFRLNTLFNHDLVYLWHRRGYFYCTSLNYLMRVMVVKSGLFSEDDIELKYSTTWFISMHQYLRIRISDKEYINVDPWSYHFGIDLGDYSHGFHSGSVNQIR